METFIIGDTHGDLSKFYYWQMRFSKKNFNLIHVGDVGIGFPHYKKNYIERLNRQFKRCGIMFYGCRGNHDNPRYWNVGDGAEHIKLSNFELVPDGEVRNISGKDVLFFGGASSVDRCVRKHGWDYWSNEHPILDINKLGNHDNVDVVITHGCPSRVIPVTLPTAKGDGIVQHFAKRDITLVEDLKSELKLFDTFEQFILDSYDIEKWYFGHYHISQTCEIDDIEYRCLDISEIVELNRTQS